MSVIVEWDADGQSNTYRCGGGGVDIIAVDELRALKKGEQIAVGCKVRPGRDFTSYISVHDN